MTISPEMLAIFALGFLAGLASGVSITFGLYLGERGRRKDAQRREGVLYVEDDRPKPIVRGPGGYDPRNTADAELAQVPEDFIRATIDETGCSREQAEAEWRILLARGMGDGGQGWMQES